jgi:hypothetical protein
LATPLGNTRRKIKFSSSNIESNNEDAGDKTQVPYEGNINHPMNIDELPEELKQQVEAKFNAVLKAFFRIALTIDGKRLLNSGNRISAS